MNSETATVSETSHADQALVRSGDPSLSLSPKKLAGSDKCLNCGTGLKGPFCYFCGQPDRNFMRFFPALLRDLMKDLLDLDSRFMRTIKPLLFKPGRLTRDYMEGRRFRYDYAAAATASFWVIVAISVWIPVYMLFSLRVVYQQNWLMTMGKFVMIGISYMTLLGIVTTGVAIASFVLL